MSESSRRTELDSTQVLTWIESAYRLEARIEASLQEHELSLAKLNVLTHLAEARRSLALGEIAAKLKCVRSNVTQLVDRLESDGLVRRLYDPADRRSVRAELTDLGRKRQSDGAAALERVGKEVGASLASADMNALQRLAAALK